MSALTCVEVRELAPEFALGILGGAERAEVVLHVNGCTRCQAYISELTEAADVLPQLVPEVEPPAGFEARVLRHLDEDRRRSRRRWVAAVAAVAASVAIFSVTVVRVIESNDRTPTRSVTEAPSASKPVAVAMETTAQLPAGWAYVSDHHGVAMAVSYGMPSGEYTVQAKSPAGRAEALGTMTVADNYGSWTGRSERALTTGARIALVDSSGNEVCHGTVPAAE